MLKVEDREIAKFKNSNKKSFTNQISVKNVQQVTKTCMQKFTTEIEADYSLNLLNSLALLAAPNFSSASSFVNHNTSLFSEPSPLTSTNFIIK